MNQSKVDCCASCWSGKRKCQRADNGYCRSCIHHLRERKIYNQSSIKYAVSLYKPAIHEQLFKDAPIGSLRSLDTTGGDLYTISLYITPSIGPVVQCSEQISGPYKTHNEVAMNGLDELGRKFSADLKAKEGDFQLVRISTLAGGFMHLLCSLVTVTENANTSRNGCGIENEYTAYNIAAHFKYILICRLLELFGEILNALRSEDQGQELPYWRADAYAAGAILRCEMEYFTNSIKNGHLREHIPHGVRSLLSDWFASIDCELEDRLRLGCARFTSWRASSIEGSMKSLRRHRETLDIDMHMQLDHYTEQEFSPLFSAPSPYNSIGHGMGTLAREPFIPHPNLAMGNGSQPLISTEITESSWYIEKLSEDFQAPSLSSIDPAWKNPAGFSKPEFGLLGTKQATTDSSINPQNLLLKDGNQTIYEALD